VTERGSQRKSKMCRVRIRAGFTLKAIFPICDLLLRTRITSCTWTFSLRLPPRDVCNIKNRTLCTYVSAYCFRTLLPRLSVEEMTVKGTKRLILILSRIFKFSEGKNTLIMSGLYSYNFYMYVIIQLINKKDKKYMSTLL
jgi:hypothetical protein